MTAPKFDDSNTSEPSRHSSKSENVSEFTDPEHATFYQANPYGRASQLLVNRILLAMNIHFRELPGRNALGELNAAGITLENTAEFILGSVESLFPHFEKFHSDLEETQRLDLFLKRARSSLEQGFREARDILFSSGFLDQTTLQGVDQIETMIRRGMDRFRRFHSEAWLNEP